MMKTFSLVEQSTDGLGEDIDEIDCNHCPPNDKDNTQKSLFDFLKQRWKAGVIFLGICLAAIDLLSSLILKLDSITVSQIVSRIMTKLLKDDFNSTEIN